MPAHTNSGAQQPASRALPATLAPSMRAAALEPAEGLCWQRWPGHYHPRNRAVLAQQLKLDRTYERLFLKPVERAVLASVLSLTNRATVHTKKSKWKQPVKLLLHKNFRDKRTRKSHSEGVYCWSSKMESMNKYISSKSVTLREKFSTAM